MKYRTIVVDPPWKQPGGGPKPQGLWNAGVPSHLPYHTMRLEELRSLPVDSMAQPDAHLYLWTTNHYLDRAFDLARCWKFEPTSTLVWVKTPRGLGMGGAFTITSEFILFCRRGSLRFIEKQETSWWNWKRGQHSRKPDAFFDLVEQVSPGPYLELFARRNRLGWDTWGNECLEHVEVGT